MTTDSRAILFRERPKPCAGDMRISWRLSICLLALLYSRGKKSSFARMHVLNDALRSSASRDKLEQILQGSLPPVYWRLRVEPAFSRALDFLVGEGFATWEISSERTALKMTEAGLEAAEAINKNPELLVQERAFLEGLGKQVTEGFVRNLLVTGKRLV